jgi:DNA-binding NarL/FixJ family response regulator
MKTPDDCGVTVLLIEDHSLVRRLVANHLRGQLKQCEIIEADSLARLATLADKIGGVRLAIVDLELPDGNAIEWIEGATSQYPDLRVIVLSSVNQDVTLYRALRCGVAGFVHKSDDLELLETAISNVLGGAGFLSPKIQHMRAAMSAHPDFFAKILSEREQAVLRCIAQGLSVPETASVLGMSENAVFKHRNSVKGKLGIRNDQELTLYAVRKGFVNPGPNGPGSRGSTA